jgi:hypothetical protein
MGWCWVNVGVKSVVSTLCQPHPVWPNERTFAAPLGMGTCPAMTENESNSSCFQPAVGSKIPKTTPRNDRMIPGSQPSVLADFVSHG